VRAKRIVAAICDRCGYVEVPADESLTHCERPMRGIGKAELRRMDANDPGLEMPREWRAR
jgi:uncharacterized OB-fold protein